MIDFELSEELQMVQRTARELAEQKIRPRLREAEASGEVPADLEQAYRELGFASVEIPEAYGGLGLGHVARVVVEEELAFGDPGIALGLPRPGPYAEMVLALGTVAQKEELSDLVARSARGAIAWTDAPPGRTGTFSTIAVETHGGGWRIDGTKSFVVNGHKAEALLVFAEARPKIGARFAAVFRVDPRADRVKVSVERDLLGLSAAPPATFAFDGVHVAESHRLSGASDFDARVIAALSRIALAGAARQVGLASASLETSRAYAADRKAFGKPIAHFQSIAFLVADMATEVEVMRQMVRRAAHAADRMEEDALRLAAMAIAECHDGAMFVANNAVQVLGGAGFVRDWPVEKWMRDAKAHMAYAMPRSLCDLLTGRLALEGARVTLADDAPMPDVQPVMI